MDVQGLLVAVLVLCALNLFVVLVLWRKAKTIGDELQLEFPDLSEGEIDRLRAGGPGTVVVAGAGGPGPRRPQ